MENIRLISMAEAGMTEDIVEDGKNDISHRGQALKKMSVMLLKKLKDE